jgi:tryptophan synthase beta subunit
MSVTSTVLKTGFFGTYGGQVVPPALQKNLTELSAAFLSARKDKQFQKKLRLLLRSYANRPSGMYEAKRLAAEAGGARIFLKREDLNHTGSHKINNVLGQALLAQQMGKTKLLAETGAGQHGVAVATAAALLGMQARIYMGERDVKNQAMNVDRMQLLGAEVVSVTAGQGTLKDAVDAALQAYISEPDAYYLLGSAVGPHPYPIMVREFQRVIGDEAIQQIKQEIGRLPDAVVACVGGGSNALGLFTAFIPHQEVKIVAAEPGGLGRDSNRHGLSLLCGQTQTLHGFTSKVLLTDAGEVAESYSAASGLDYPGVSPELSYYYDQGRLSSVPVSDAEAVQAMVTLSRCEGIIPALESAHAVAAGMELAGKLGKQAVIIINLSGRGDKDVTHVVRDFPELTTTQQQVIMCR